MDALCKEITQEISSGIQVMQMQLISYFQSAAQPTTALDAEWPLPSRTRDIGRGKTTDASFAKAAMKEALTETDKEKQQRSERQNNLVIYNVP